MGGLVGRTQASPVYGPFGLVGVGSPQVAQDKFAISDLRLSMNNELSTLAYQFDGYYTRFWKKSQRKRAKELATENREVFSRVGGKYGRGPFLRGVYVWAAGSWRGPCLDLDSCQITVFLFLSCFL
jgi:hypothetical protein